MSFMNGTPWSVLRRVKFRDQKGELLRVTGYQRWLASLASRICPYCGVYYHYVNSHIGAMRRWHPKSHRRKMRGRGYKKAVRK